MPGLLFSKLVPKAVILLALLLGHLLRCEHLRFQGLETSLGCHDQGLFCGLISAGGAS